MTPSDAVLREAIERADVFASAQERLISTQRELIDLLQAKVRELSSENAELKAAFEYGSRPAPGSLPA